MSKDIDVKECSHCKVSKPYNNEHFYKDSSSKTGLESRCKECKRKKNNEYKRNNKDKIRQIHSVYKKNNRDRFNVYDQKRRSRKKKLAASFTHKDWQSVLDTFDHSCAYCGSTEEIQQEHYIPVSANGTYTKDNIIPACATCNQSKNDRNINDWFKSQSYYVSERMDKIIAHFIIAKWGTGEVQLGSIQ